MLKAPITVREALPSDMAGVLDLVQRLLLELGVEGEETGTLDTRPLTAAWRGPPLRLPGRGR